MIAFLGLAHGFLFVFLHCCILFILFVSIGLGLALVEVLLVFLEDYVGLFVSVAVKAAAGIVSVLPIILPLVLALENLDVCLGYVKPLRRHVEGLRYAPLRDRLYAVLCVQVRQRVQLAVAGVLTLDRIIQNLCFILTLGR